MYLIISTGKKIWLYGMNISLQNIAFYNYNSWIPFLPNFIYKFSYSWTGQTLLFMI